MKTNNIQKLKKQRGQSMVEYAVIVTYVIVVALYSADDVRTAIVDALKGSYQGYSYTISIAEMPDEKK